MRIPLIGSSYAAWSVAGADQTCMNLFPEPFENQEEKEKGFGMLIGCPGRHLFKDLTTINAALTPFRGVWSGGGRVWAAAGAHYLELSSSGALVGSIRDIDDDATHSPVLFFANGNQLFIVSAGKAYVDNGSGPTVITLPASTGTASGLGVGTNRLSGDEFTPNMVGQNFTIAATTKVVAQVFGPDYLTVTVSWGGSPVTGDYTCSPTFPASSGAFLDGYFIASLANTKQFNWSPLLDGSNAGTYVWDQNDRASKESYPDYIRSILVNGEQLYLFGTESFEVWQAAISGSSTFQRIDGATGRWGVSSPWCAITIDGKVFFLASNTEGQLSAFVLEGFTPRRISTFAQEADWKNQLLGSTVISCSYFEEGHHFWELDPGSGVSTFTWVYDLATTRWHQRARYSAGNFTVYGVRYHTFVTNSATSGNDWGAGGTHLVGGDGTGKLYTQSLSFYDDAGNDIKWQRTLPYAYNGGAYIYFGRTELEMQTGAVASGAEPVIAMDYSDDRGNTFVDSQDAGIGLHNDYSKIVLWPPTGASPNRLYRFSGVGQSKVVLVDCNQDRTMGYV